MPTNDQDMDCGSCVVGEFRHGYPMLVRISEVGAAPGIQRAHKVRLGRYSRRRFSSLTGVVSHTIKYYAEFLLSLLCDYREDEFEDVYTFANKRLNKSSNLR